MSLSDNNAALNELQERVSQLQRALTSSEHDRRVLQERLDSTRLNICYYDLFIKLCNVNRDYWTNYIFQSTAFDKIGTMAFYNQNLPQVYSK